jgi:hypothetical protein
MQMDKKKVESEVRTITLKGNWLKLWIAFTNSQPNESESELVRQALAIRAAMGAVDREGNLPEVLIRYKNEEGEVVTEDLLTHIGMRREASSVKGS